mmetsp:Transcript_148200/g.475975  ORF Transcript_148200/g.475975 Transcript_148200/m.475975 type:complete len:1751 (-) Transcript_148200:103-5355(-)
MRPKSTKTRAHSGRRERDRDRDRARPKERERERERAAPKRRRGEEVVQALDADEAASRASSVASQRPNKECAIPLQLRALGSSTLALVSLPRPTAKRSSAQEALDWLAEALPAALSELGAEAGISALTAGRAIGTTAVVVPEAALRLLPPPPGAEVDQPWVALKASAAGQGPGGAPPSAALLSALGAQLSAAGLRWSTLLGSEDQAILLVREEDLPAATVALVRGGHAVGPPDRVCHVVPPEDSAAADRNMSYVGVWSLTRREQPAQVVVEQHATRDGPLRIQAPSGVYVEIRIPKQAKGMDSSVAQKSCAGYHVVVDAAGGRQVSLRHRAVDFRPPTGSIVCTTVRFDHEVMGELSYPRGRFRDEYIEAWTRLEAGPVTALELVGELPRPGGKDAAPRCGYWLFCGDRWARVVGPKRGQGLVAGSCCASLAQLEMVGDPSAIREELQTLYEACWGILEPSGKMSIGQDAWGPELAGQTYYDATSEVGGTISVLKQAVIHRLPNGVEQRWAVRDWAYNPFAPRAVPPAPASTPSAPTALAAPAATRAPAPVLLGPGAAAALAAMGSSSSYSRSTSRSKANGQGPRGSRSRSGSKRRSRSRRRRRRRGGGGGDERRRRERSRGRHRRGRRNSPRRDPNAANATQHPQAHLAYPYGAPPGVMGPVGAPPRRPPLASEETPRRPAAPPTGSHPPGFFPGPPGFMPGMTMPGYPHAPPGFHPGMPPLFGVMPRPGFSPPGHPIPGHPPLGHHLHGHPPPGHPPPGALGGPSLRGPPPPAAGNRSPPRRGDTRDSKQQSGVVSKAKAAAAKAAADKPSPPRAEPKAPVQAAPLIEEVAKAVEPDEDEDLPDFGGDEDADNDAEGEGPRDGPIEGPVQGPAPKPSSDSESEAEEDDTKADLSDKGKDVEKPSDGAADDPQPETSQAELRAGARTLRKRLKDKLKNASIGVAKNKGPGADGPLAEGAVAKTNAGQPPPHMYPPHGMPPYGHHPHMPPMMYPPMGPPPGYGPPLHAPPQSPPAQPPRDSKRSKKKNKNKTASGEVKAAGAVAKSAHAAGAVAKSAHAAGAVAKSGAAQGKTVMPRNFQMAERRKLLDDEEDGPPSACRYLVVVWPDRRLAYHMVRTRQLALTHFKEDYTGKINMQTGYRLMMLVPPDERKEKADVYGFIIFRLEDQNVVVVQIAIADEHRGKGFGKQAVDWIIGYAENARSESIILGSPLESVEYFEECGFARATTVVAIGGKDLPVGMLPMEYHRGTRKALGAQRRQLSREELVNRVFDILDGDCDGNLSRAELKRYAGWSGFGGTEEQWVLEFSRICAETKASESVGVDRLLFAKLINDRTEAGLFIDNDGLRDMLTQLQIQTPQHLQRKSQKAAATVSEASRRDFLRAIFKLCDVDRDGLLDAKEMQAFAVRTGAAEMDKAQWKEEFEILCADNGADPSKGISVQLLEKMVNDKSESGCYCDDDELRAIKGALELEGREVAMRAAAYSPERTALVHEVFRMFDTDGDGRLGEQELRAFAEHLGFKGSEAQWAEEFRSICMQGGAGSEPVPPDANRFLVLVNDTAESGWYCTDEELRRMLEDGPAAARPRPAEAAPRPMSPTASPPASPLGSSEVAAASGPPAVAPASPAVASPAAAACPAAGDGGSGGAAASSSAPAEPSRAELVRTVFDALVPSGGSGGGVGEKEMWRFAVFTGFDGTASEWAEEFQMICKDAGGVSALDFPTFARLVDDGGDGGCFSETAELRSMAAQLTGRQ